MIHIRNLEKTFSPDFTLKIGELDICDGDRVALIGMNGSGKSTLLRLIAGQMRADRGEISIDTPQTEIGYQPQTPYAFRGTAEYNIKIAGRKNPELGAIFSACELDALRDKKMSALSGGEKQRVFLARMLAGNYKLMLLDEPLSAADLKTGARLSEVLLEACEKNRTTLLFSTHLPRQAFRIATKIMLLDRGEIVEFETAERMKAPQSAFGNEFLSQWNV